MLRQSDVLIRVTSTNRVLPPRVLHTRNVPASSSPPGAATSGEASVSLPPSSSPDPSPRAAELPARMLSVAVGVAPLFWSLHARRKKLRVRLSHQKKNG